MTFFCSAILVLAFTSAIFAETAWNPPKSEEPVWNPRSGNPQILNSQMMGMMNPYMGQQQSSIIGMNPPYQSMMMLPGSMIGMNPQMMNMLGGYYPYMGQQTMLGMNPYQSSMLGMPGMTGFGNNPMMMSPFNGMSGLSPYGIMGGQQQMLGGYPVGYGRK